MTVLKEIISSLTAYQNCIEKGNTEWKLKHDERLDYLEKIYLPRGSGIDCGTKIDRDSQRNRLILLVSFHHMDENGYYDGWTNHRIVISPDLLFDFKISIGGPNRNNIKEYLHETFQYELTKEVEKISFA